ncbi:MAG: cytochrome B [Synechococcaceae cyanobacterium]
MARPYQPSLLRLVHGATVLLVPLSWFTGVLVYLRHDARLVRLPFSLDGEWVDIHGTVGVLLWPIALLFGLYAVTAGRARLRQPANSLALVALALAVGSGKMMDEDWLRQTELHHLVYNVHLFAWVLITLAATLHVVTVLQRGGMPLARSMASVQVRPNDLPGHWPAQILRSFRGRP